MFVTICSYYDNFVPLARCQSPLLQREAITTSMVCRLQPPPLAHAGPEEESER